MIDLQQGERIIQIYRRHWFVLFFAMLQIALAVALAIAAPFAVASYFPEVFETYGAFVMFGSVLVIEVLWLVFFLTIADYYLDAWIISNERLIFVEVHGLFARVVSTVSLRNIQDISTEVKGMIPTILKFGDVRIQSAGTQGSFVFKQVGHPYEIKNLILATRDSAVSGMAES